MYTILFAILLVMNITDVAFTKLFVGKLGGDELNPVANWLIFHYGWIGLLVAKVAPCLLGLSFAHLADKWTAPVKTLIWIAVLSYTWLTVYHVFHAFFIMLT